jgi:F-type H+-transporting ATPase subunit epsilon
MNKFSLAVYTEDKMVLEEEVEALVAPGADGYLGVWANHAPLLTALQPGRLAVRVTREEVRRYAVSGGFLEVARNRAALLADAVEAPQEIDVARAREARDRAERRLHEHAPDTDVPRARAALARALNRLAVAQAP